MIKVSIITPSYNQGAFIEATINSVLEQEYPLVEYIIIDGGSTDNTVEIIKKYEAKLAYWQSKKDKGQANAINIGLSKSTGNILAYLNSDDILLPGAIKSIVNFFINNKDIGLVYGDRIIINESGQEIGYRKCKCYVPGQLYYYSGIPQETAFWTRDVFEKIGYFNERFHFAMDREYWVRISKAYKIIHIPKYLGAYRVHGLTKTNTISHIMRKENKIINDMHNLKKILPSNIFLFYASIYKKLFGKENTFRFTSSK